MPDGRVHPCIMSRWLELGNVHDADLATIHAGAAATRAELVGSFAERPTPPPKPNPWCVPKAQCSPRCTPVICCPGAHCDPMRPR